MKKRFIPFIISVLFILAQPFFQTVQAQKEQIPLSHEVTVTLKLVQVYVTEKKGNPVLDLEKKDFVLYDNGKQQTLTEFERHVLSLPSLKTEPETIVPTPLPTPSELMSRKFFLFFDFGYSSIQGVLRAKQAALHFLDTQLQLSDEVGVLSYSLLKGLIFHEYLTTEHRKVREVVEKFGLKDTAGRAEDLEARYLRELEGRGFIDAAQDARATLHEGGGAPDQIGQPEQMKPTPITKDMGDQFNTQNTLKDNRLLRDDRVLASRFTQKISEMAKALRYVPGHKYFIFFSAGVPSSLMYGMPPSYDTRGNVDTMLSLGDNILRGKFENMCKELSASNTCIYAFNTDETSMADPRVTGVYSLQQMAISTGGKYFGDVRSYEQHVEKIQNLTGSYYVLGYYIDEQWDGKYHKIKVDVQRPGCSVYAQGGYFSSKPFAQYSKLEKMLHLIDLALAEKPLSQTPLRFPMAALACSVEKEPNLCLMAKIPVDKIKEISGKKVEMVNLIFDSKENIVELKRGEEDFSRYPGENAYYYSLLSLNPGVYRCRIVIRNLETGQGAVAASTVVIPEKPQTGIKLFPPLLLTSEKNALYLKGFAPKKESAKQESFSLADYYSFDSVQYAPFLANQLRGNSTVSAIVRCSIIGIPAAEVKNSAYLIERSSGKESPLSVLLLSETKGKDLEVFFLNLEIPELPPGAYDLKLVAEEATSQSKSQVTKAFDLR